MTMFHDGFVGQTCARGLLYDLLEMGAISDRQNIFNSGSMKIGEPRRLNKVWNPDEIVQPPDDILEEDASWGQDQIGLANHPRAS